MGAIGDFFTKLFTVPARASRDAAIKRGEIKMSTTGYYGGYGYGPGLSNTHGRLTDGSKSNWGLSRSGMNRVFDHNKLRANARDAMFDSVHARGIVQRFADMTVDTGLKLRLEPNFRVLGITQEQASEWATDVSERFHLWAKSKDSSIDGVNNFYQNQHLYSFAQQRENDMFIRLHYVRNPRLVSSLQIQFIDPSQVRGLGFTSTGTVLRNVDGIDRDRNGKEIGYKIWIVDQSEKGGYRSVDIPAMAGSRRLMLHGFNPEFAGQGRGFSRLSHALQEFEQLTDFTQAQIMKAINQSQMVMYVKPSKDAPSSNPIADLMGSAGPRVDPADMFGANPTQAELVTNEIPVDFNMLAEFSQRQPGGMFVANLQSGEDLGAFPNTAPSDSFDQFVNAFVTYLSASVSMPIEVLTMKFGENYSASRATLVLLWRVLMIWRAEMAADFLDPVVEMWVSEEIAAGRIQAPGWSDPRLRAAWCQCRWIGAPVPSIDPKKEADADMVRTEMGHLTLDDGAMNFNGSSGEANRAKLATELPELKIPVWSKNFQYGPDAVTADDGEDDDNGGDDDVDR
jgi:lambda family phage portal protein